MTNDQEVGKVREWSSPCGYRLLNGDVRDVLPTLPDESVQCVVTSPPYFGLRDYGCDGQIGLEATPDAFVQTMVEVFRECRRVLKDDGTLWLNLGDSYVASGAGEQGKNGQRSDRRHTQQTLRVGVSGNKGNASADFDGPHRSSANVGVAPKNLLGIPWRVAFALQQDGWYLRQDIIWHKPNPMPESVTDRCTKSHEYIFLLSKSRSYYFDQDAIAEKASGLAGGNIQPNRSFVDDPIKHRTKAGLVACQQRAREAGGFETRNRRSVWTVTTKPYAEAHFATFPPDLIRPCILAGCPEGGVVLDPFAGSGTTLAEAVKFGRKAIGIELNPAYCELVKRRVGREEDALGLFAEVETQPTLFQAG